MNEDKIFRDIERLRDPQRLALLETERVVSLCLQGPKLEKVLDIGTGSGVFAEVFSHSGLNVTGIDLQEPMLEAARRFVPKAHFQMADSKALPFGDDSFDLCFLGLVLHEAGRPLLTLQEARRVCTDEDSRAGMVLYRTEFWPSVKRSIEIRRSSPHGEFLRLFSNKDDSHGTLDSFFTGKIKRIHRFHKKGNEVLLRVYAPFFFLSGGACVTFLTCSASFLCRSVICWLSIAWFFFKSEILAS